MHSPGHGQVVDPNHSNRHREFHDQRHRHLHSLSHVHPYTRSRIQHGNVHCNIHAHPRRSPADNSQLRWRLDTLGQPRHLHSQRAQQRPNPPHIQRLRPRRLRQQRTPTTSRRQRPTGHRHSRGTKPAHRHRRLFRLRGQNPQVRTLRHIQLPSHRPEHHPLPGPKPGRPLRHRQQDHHNTRQHTTTLSSQSEGSRRPLQLQLHILQPAPSSLKLLHAQPRRPNSKHSTTRNHSELRNNLHRRNRTLLLHILLRRRSAHNGHRHKRSMLRQPQLRLQPHLQRPRKGQRSKHLRPHHHQPQHRGNLKQPLPSQSLLERSNVYRPLPGVPSTISRPELALLETGRRTYFT